MADLATNLTVSVTLLVAPPLNAFAVSILQHLKGNILIMGAILN